jgi:Protein of unknown function (DUF2889)
MLPETDSEPFRASGLPLHTRTLSVEAWRSAGERLRVAGVVLDLRKCGFVPTGGELQTAGFIHHMQLVLEIDAATASIERLETAQPTVAFEASAVTGGTSCRDPAPRLQALVGERLDAGFVRRVASAFGGPLGCSHLLTLAQLMGASVPRFLATAPALREFEVGERVAKRSLFLDGFERSDGGLDVALQLSDFSTRPRRAVHGPLDRLASQHELRLLARIDAGVSRLEALDARERIRDPGSLGSAAWRCRADAVSGLVGGPALRGLAARVLAALGDAPQEEPLRSALLNLAPGVIQCLAALSNRLLAQLSAGGTKPPGRLPRALSVGGTPDSCYMWRSDGPLARLRGAAEPPADP